MIRNGSKQQSICGDSQCPGPSCQVCEAIRISVDEHARITCPHGVPSCEDGKLCDKCAKKRYSKHEQLQMGGVAVGGRSASDVVSLQEFNLYSSRSKCDKCHQQEGLNPACEKCVILKTTEVPPFTKNDVKTRHAEMKSGFSGRTIELVVLLHSLLIASIDWTMHNCAFSTLILMLSSSNAGMNSINQQIFAGYILAVIINTLQESGKCDPIILEVFRLELSMISGNPAWSNWSDLIEYQDLYKLCVDHQIILDNEVDFVLRNYDGSYNIRQTLTGKNGSTLIGAFKWNPSGNVLANGIFSSDFNSRYKISAVILFHNDHFSIILFSQGIWLIDGKGKRTGMFKAESSIRELTIEESLELCASHGAFYFLEEIPFVYETLNLFGRQGLPPIKVSYGEKWYFLYDDGTMVCETTRTIVKLQRTVFMTDDRGNHFRVFPALPPPPASSVSGQWVPPSPPPIPYVPSGWVPTPRPQASCAQDVWVPSPSPLPAPSAQQAPQQSPKKVAVWFIDNYYSYDPENKDLRSITGRIIDGIKAGFYDVQEKETRGEIRIELREVLSDDALPPPAPSAQVFIKIQLADITISRDGEWSIRRDSFFKKGTCFIRLGMYILDDIQYNQTQFLTFLNVLYKRSCK